MTKQEAIKILDWIPTKGDEVDAMEMAIEALSAELDNNSTKVVNKNAELSCSEEPNRSDLISRQQTINSTKYIFENDWMYPESQEKYVLEMLEDLPSAQPEIIRCKDCKHWGKRGLCDKWDYYISNDDFYCGCAERRTDE